MDGQADWVSGMDINLSPAPVRRLAVIGVGLMGGSLALAARRLPEVVEVRGFDADPAVVAHALEQGVITQSCSSVAEAAAGADLAVVATPVGHILGAVEECGRARPLPRLISDMGSTKSSIMRGLSSEVRRIFVGGHPICGGETAGLRYTRPNLFEGALYFLCAPSSVSSQRYQAMHAFVQSLGARPVAIDPEAHDQIVALVSHVPHVLANVLMTEVGRCQPVGRRALFCVGPSFRDLTRVAGANPDMWRDIFLENRQALVQALQSIVGRIDDFCDELMAEEVGEVSHSIEAAAAFRQELLALSDITPETLYRVTVRIPDEPGLLSRVMTALGNANINIEDLTLHHFSRAAGGDLVLFLAGQEAAEQAGDILNELGYPPVVEFAGR